MKNKRRVSDIRSILIVEDVREQRQYLIESASSFNSNIKIYNTGKKSEALVIINDNDIGAFFIDIQLLDGNGIDLAKEIRKIKKYQFTPIVFITGERTREMEAFHEIHCYDYILKPYTRKSITDIMTRIMVDYFDQEKDDTKYLHLDFRGLKQRINTKDIILVENRDRRIFIRTQFEEIKYKKINIHLFQKELPDFFLQIHQSILVNRNYIEKIDMVSGNMKLRGLSEDVPVGVSFRKKVGELIHGIL